MMQIIPAIDLKDGKCVRLLQGRMEDNTVYSSDPAGTAKRWVDAGAEKIHVVDLDGAFSKKPQNLTSIQKILASVDVPIQLGGGIRNLETIGTYIAMGISQVIIGSEAIKNPSLVKDACGEFPGRIIVGIDARNGKVAIEGWTRTTDTDAVNLAKMFEDCGVAAINFTDIQRDGMQSGPNIIATRQLAESVSIPVVASGGVSVIQDIIDLLPLATVGVVGVITGKALYSGTLKLEEALQVVKMKTNE